MRIQPIVEGHGEVEAVPILLRRLMEQAECYEIEVNHPIRRPRNQLVQEDQLGRAIDLAKLQEDCGAILILFDSDDDCPKELGPQLQEWAQQCAGEVPCVVVLAEREYEAWFLGSLESLRKKRGIRPDAESIEAPEKPRDAKKRLNENMQENRRYTETIDQAALTAEFDLRSAFRNCRSFRKLVTAFGTLCRQMGSDLSEWPPPEWVDAPN